MAQVEGLAFSFNECLDYLLEKYYVEDDIYPGGRFFAPAAEAGMNQEGEPISVAAGAMIHHVRDLNHQGQRKKKRGSGLDVGVPKPWDERLRSHGFEYDYQEARRIFMTANTQSGMDEDAAKVAWENYAHNGTITTPRGKFTFPLSPLDSSFFSDTQKDTLRHTVTAFLLQQENILFNLPKDHKYQFDEKMVRNCMNTSYFDFKLAGGCECSACEAADDGGTTDARILEADDIIPRKMYSEDIPVPSSMRTAMFDRFHREGKLQRLSVKHHRDKSYRSDAIRHGPTRMAHRERLDHLSQYKLLWKVCLCCGKIFDPDKTYYIDMHHVGGSEGIELSASGKQVVGRKITEVSRLAHNGTDYYLYSKDEMVKCVPICCECHRILTYYCDRDYAENHDLTSHLREVNTVEIPLGVGTVHKPPRGTYKGF
mmetsp:Transcript_22744/g.50561  ORF Transcript_22744/g.50561 Transcript_22744/m.50561 type:complete len:426 (-) Transcript_22744:51-1328(-)